MIFSIIILAAAIFIVLVVVIPLRLNLSGSVGLEKSGFDAHIRLLYGIINFHFIQKENRYLEFFFMNLKLFKKELKEKEEKEEDKTSKKKMNWLFRLPQLMENAQDVPELNRPVYRLLSKARKAIKVKDFKLNSRVGFEDPYLTGVFYGCYTAFSGALGNWLPYGVYLQPDFVNEGFQGDFYAELEIVQTSLIIPLMLLVTRKSFRNVIKTFRGKKNE